MFSLELPILAKDNQGLFLISIFTLTHALSDALKSSTAVDQRMFLTLRRADGRLVASSHGKFWSHSDSNTDLEILPGITPAFWTPEQCTDAVIQEAAIKTKAKHGTWVVNKDVDEVVSLKSGGKYAGDWLVLSSRVKDNMELWLLQNSDTIFGQVRRALARTVVVFAVLICAAVLFGCRIAFLTAYPLVRLSRQLVRVAEMDFNGLEDMPDDSAFSRDDVIPAKPQQNLLTTTSALREVAELEVSFRTMLVSVSSFAKYVPVGVVRSILHKGRLPQLRVEPVAEVAVLFVDIKGFTALSQILSPESVAQLLEVTLGDLSHCVTANRGTVDKYIGDCVMALWGCPDADASEGNDARVKENTSPGTLACRAAAAMLATIQHSTSMRLVL